MGTPPTGPAALGMIVLAFGSETRSELLPHDKPVEQAQ
jgi:hypothetical protein